MPKLDLVHELPDGRKLGYCCFGDPSGQAVVALHGTPGSRYKFAVADAEAKRLGLRLISPDRWGYGLSEEPRGEIYLADYATDVDSLLSELRVDEFSVVGISGGGPFAVALAAVFADRVRSLALVAPVSPVDNPERRHGVSAFHQFCFRVLPRLPGIIPLVFSSFRAALAVSPRLAMRLTSARAGRADRALISQPDIAADLADTFKAGLAHGVRGPQIDMSLFSRSWQVDLLAVSGKSRMWLGTQDRNVPLAAAKRLARDIPELELIELADSGHFWIAQNFSQVLAWLAEATGDGPARSEEQKDQAAAAADAPCV